jgi:hypothetical protein
VDDIDESQRSAGGESLFSLTPTDLQSPRAVNQEPLQIVCPAPHRRRSGLRLRSALLSGKPSVFPLSRRLAPLEVAFNLGRSTCLLPASLLCLPGRLGLALLQLPLPLFRLAHLFPGDLLHVALLAPFLGLQLPSEALLFPLELGCGVALRLLAGLLVLLVRLV